MSRDEPSQQQAMASVLFDGLLRANSDSDLIRHIHDPTEVEDVVQAMGFARQLGIPPPPIRKVIANEQNAYCIMERVEGITLEQAWLNLGWCLTIKLALQLRRFIKCLRSATSSMYRRVAGVWRVQVILARGSLWPPTTI
ncbi:hypothetical protein P175DRAFT_0533791 [Aspergillus ochraceoroseus IBT 24754]|uniref:Aminoglycoside phosphotransferase domain-containing protein n=1 Tax=Aspergillus ochraceoroseus IBT 24754 TaxID=1392256 RepID=A0A2T5LSU7_9EURO|nr:uncharacterized protein P175DRAFT_0533791 [Aspergillus ochraceoroseus IBT 24754]PTU19357.1 hypothetical protein P175DRAFT_0533791 [Aspergillus ochraceoroseus IBT 24754]